jgi:ELWxxDGT repeat protein
MKKIVLFISILLAFSAHSQAILVKDLETGNLSSMPTYKLNRVDYNGKLIFSALNNTSGSYGTWITDGTESGTELLYSNGGGTTNPPQYFTYLNAVNKVFFSAVAGSNVSRLWSTDGVPANTLYADNYSIRPKYITEFNNRVYFQGRTSSTWGYELVYANGGSGTNTFSININLGSKSSYPEELTVIGNKLYFSAIADDNEGRELCVSDGTPSGTLRIKDINTTGSDSSNPQSFISFNNKVYFTADDGVNGKELWVTDGTAANTQIVSDLNPGSDPSLNPSEKTALIVYKDELYFTAYTPSTGNELFKVNTSGNIVNVADINPGANGHSNPKDFFVFDDKLFYSADNGTDGVELWYTETGGNISSKSTASTTNMFKNINPNTGPTNTKDSNPTNFFLFDNKMYFSASNGANGNELWVSDGTVAGTVMKQDINPVGDSNPRDFIISNSLLFFSANDGTNGDELWKFSNNIIIGSLSPKDNSTTAKISGEKLSITLNRNLQKGSGNIVIYKSSDDSVFETINVASSSVTINNNTVTITPSLDFNSSEDYYVQIDNGALKDMSNNLFIGISDKTTWNFKTLGKQSQTITFNAITTKTYGDVDFQLNATSSSNLAVSYTSSDTNVATVNGNNVTIIGAGSTTITASQPGDANYNPATDATQTLTVEKANQTLSFGGTFPNKTYGDPQFTITATSDANLPITSYTSSNTSVATVNGNTVTIVGAGYTLLRANQSGNNNYNSATYAQSFNVSKANQTITFGNALPNATYGDSNFNLNSTSSSGLSITYTSSNTGVATISGNTVTIIGAGTSVITAKQIGNTNYNPANDVSETLAVAKANQTITFNPLSDVDVNDPDFNLTATSSSNLAITYASSNTNVATITNNVVSIIGVGTTTITASQTGNNNYNAAIDVAQNLTVTTTASIDNFKKLGLVLYPNPISDSFTIKTKLHIEKIEIYNIIGKKVKEFTKQKNKYSIQELPEGIYLIKIGTEKGVGTTKILKVKS